MSTSRIKVNTRPHAEAYSRPGERIVEFSSPHGGGLLSFRITDDRRLIVEVYREDDTVQVISDKRHHATAEQGQDTYDPFAIFEGPIVTTDEGRTP